MSTTYSFNGLFHLSIDLYVLGSVATLGDVLLTSPCVNTPTPQQRASRRTLLTRTPRARQWATNRWTVAWPIPGAGRAPRGRVLGNGTSTGGPRGRHGSGSTPRPPAGSRAVQSSRCRCTCSGRHYPVGGSEIPTAQPAAATLGWSSSVDHCTVRLRHRTTRPHQIPG